MYLLTKLGRAGWENIWLEVMAYGPSAARSVRHEAAREAVRFCSRAVRLFPAPLAQMRTASIRDFAKKALARPYGSYDNMYLLTKWEG